MWLARTLITDPVLVKRQSPIIHVYIHFLYAVGYFLLVQNDVENSSQF
uniref:Uncharacterized protein n=1 Tax=Anguilla anguilla TaxID=7936 RepID=A0A0E9S4Q2_ANGAN